MYTHEEGVATHSSILAWRIPQDRGAWKATVHGVPKGRESDTTDRLSTTYVYTHRYIYLSVHLCVNISNQLNGPEFEQTLADSEQQGSLAWCSPCDYRVGRD